MARTKRGQAYHVKYSEENPTMKAIRKYEHEIAVLEEKRAKANEDKDWSMRNWYTNQIMAKTKNMELLKESYGSKRTSKELAVNDDW